MKLERSDTFFPPWSAWRIESWYFPWGPYCYSRRDAIWEWMKQVGWKGFGGFLVMPFRRWKRWVCFECLPCGRNIKAAGHWDCMTVTSFFRRYRYCSMECAAYDGALKDPSRSWILFGRIIEPKRHYEADMKAGYLEGDQDTGKTAGSRHPSRT